MPTPARFARLAAKNSTLRCYARHLLTHRLPTRSQIDYMEKVIASLEEVSSGGDGMNGASAAAADALSGARLCAPF